jgi:3-oxoacyl-[acyl-carrier-protein] synthase-3
MTSFISQISFSLGDQSVDVAQLSQLHNFDPSFVSDKLGTGTLYRSSSDILTLIADAFSGLTHVDDIRALILCTQTKPSSIPQLAPQVAHALNLPQDILLFSLDSACTGFAESLILADVLVHSTNGRVLIVTADLYSRLNSFDNRNTALLFSDASACTVISKTGKWAFLGHASHHLASTSAVTTKSSSSPSIDISGRELASFVSAALPSTYSRLLSDRSLLMSDIKVHLFHQGSKYIVDSCTSFLDLPSTAYIPFHFPQTGNTTSSSLPISLAVDPFLQRCPPSTLMVASAFGAGMSCISLLFKSQ